MNELEALKKILSLETPLFAVSRQTDYSFLEPVLQERQNTQRTCSFEGDWRQKLSLENALNGVKSFIALGYPYPVLIPKLENITLSAYSCISDYHPVVLSSLTRLKKQLQDGYPDDQFLCLTDSGKIFEKDAALAAGLGFRGKNSLIIHPEFGSFFFIGVILSTASLPDLNPTHKKTASCGNCSRCLLACPAHAIDSQGLDPSKCISYLTQIQAGRGNFHHSFWGCDLCQLVCPYNLNRKIVFQEQFSFKFDLKILSPEKLSRKKFMEAASALPLRWAGKKNLVKNFQVLSENQETSFSPVPLTDLPE